MLLAILAIILTLLLVVGVHEAGHAVLARIFQVKIKKISIGFGKPLLRWQGKSGCEWIWACLPLGGYVQLVNTRNGVVKPEEYPWCFDKRPVWQRIVILSAGAIANLIMAWIAFVFIFFIGLDYNLPEIKAVQPHSIAAQAGMRSEERFVSIGGRATQTWGDVGMQFVMLWGKNDIPVILNRSGDKEIRLTLDLSNVKFHNTKLSLLAQLGITPDLTAHKSQLRASSCFDAIRQANETMMHMVYFFLMVLKQLFSGLIPFSVLLGPIGIFAASIVSLTQGMVVFMFFIANLSLAVAVINLFPIPGLDGGSIVYAIIEKIRGKPISVAMELLLHRLVFIVFCVVFIHLLMNDLQRL